MISLITISVLYLAFQIKHLIVDFFIQLNFQNPLDKFSADLELATRALLVHGAHHGLFTWLIAVIAGVPVEWSILLGLADMVVHGMIDAVKASPYLFKDHKKPFPDKRYFYLLGIDQFAHHLTHFGLIILIVLIIGG